MRPAAASASTPALNRLLITACLAGTGGGEVALLRHLRYSTVPKEGLVVAVLNDGPLVQAVRAMGIRCEVIGRRGRDGFYPGAGERLQAAWRLASLLRQTGTDSVLSFGMHDLLVALWARRLRSFRLAWRSQGEFSIFGADQPPDREAQTLVAAVNKYVDVVIPTTRWDAETLGGWGVPSEKLQVVYLGVDEEWLDVPATVIAGPTRVMMSGRLVKWKGQTTLIQAAARLRDLKGSLEIWIVGDGDAAYRAELEQEATTAGIREMVWFAGHRDDVRDLMAQCHVGVHCSEREPFGLVVIEAMAAGRVVIASDVQGPREIIRPGDDGYLVPPGRPDLLAERLRSLLGDSGRMAQLSERARGTAKSRFRAALNVPHVERLGFGDGRLHTSAGDPMIVEGRV